MMIRINPSSIPIIPIDWTDVLPTGTVLAGVVHTLPSPISKDTEGYDDTSSWVKFSGQLHAGTYVLDALGTLDNGETINCPVTLVCTGS